MNRNQFLSPLKEISFETNTNTSEFELFQNITLRPILKTQNDILMAIFMNNSQKYKVNFKSMNQLEKENFLIKLFQSNNQLKNILKGVVIALFTIEEFNEYQQNESELTKRIMKLLYDRILSNI